MPVISVDVERDFGTSRLEGVDRILPELLDGFDARGIRSVLFVVGEVAQARPALLRSAAERGHLVGSHSMTHAALSQLDMAARRSELVDSRRAIEDVTGKPCIAFRAPYFDASEDLGPLLEEAGYHWSSSKAPFSPKAHYRWWKDTRAPHLLAGSSVVELPVDRVLGLPMPDGLSYRRAFWPLTALARTPPSMFYLHPYELLEPTDRSDVPAWMNRLMSLRQGSWARRYLWQRLNAWLQSGAVFAPPSNALLASVR